MTRVTTDIENWGQQVADLAEQVKSARGGWLPNLYRPLLHSPSIAAGWLGFFTAVRYQAVLDGRSRELAILRVALLTGAEYEYRAHVPVALQAGVRQDQIDALPEWQQSANFEGPARAVLALADAMTRDVRVSEETFNNVRQHFSERETVELCVTIAGYNMVSRVLRALDVDHESPKG